jgi:hypothetical protein
VSSAKSQPPRSVFALDWPERDPLLPISPEKPDHEVVMEMMAGPSGKGETGSRTVRRHGPWQHTEMINGERRTIEIVHDYRQLWLQYSTDESGAPKRLNIRRYAPTPDELAKIRGALPQPLSMDRTDAALGETCHWLNLTPQMADAGSIACLTEDGIALKETFWSRTRRTEWTAIRVARRPIAIDEIKPPAELLSPQTWGVN